MGQERLESVSVHAFLSNNGLPVMPDCQLLLKLVFFFLKFGDHPRCVQPPGHWERPNFCEVMHDRARDRIYVSFERVPEWIAETDVSLTEMKKPLMSVPFDAKNCPGCVK